MARKLPPELYELQQEVETYAREYGLDMFESYYEMLDYDEVNMVAAYQGFPVRYPHWKWGMEYERLSKSYEYGLHKIYEMVINNDPCYAYLLESNSMTDQKLVMCHVSGHNDFFKNNYTFAHTNRKMMDEMANHATRVRKYMDWYGVEEVERFIDSCISIDNLIDMHSPYIVRQRKDSGGSDMERPAQRDAIPGLLPSHKEYMENYINPAEYVAAQRKKAEEEGKKKKRFPSEPERDVMRFLMESAPLTRWQRDIMDMIREEAYYFAPQAQTKIMNEGWASYWHAKLMTEKAMRDDEVIDFADKHSGVVAVAPGQLNPYKLGIELFRDIEDRWNRGRFGKEWDDCDDMAERRRWDKQLGLGREKIFQVRQIYNDVTFIDEFFTLDFCREHGFFAYGYDKKRRQFLVETRDFVEVKKKMLAQLTNFGHPVIKVIDGNFENRAELLLEHTHEGTDLDVGYGQETLKNLHRIWTRPVHLLTTFEERRAMLTFDGSEFSERAV